MHMRKQVFYKECEKRGFTTYGKSYMRVLGDGVYQHILTGFKERLHSSAPSYSQNHRHEPRVFIFIKSMYAQYDGLYINIDHTTGFSLTVPQLLNKQETAFMGAEVETEQLLDEGLDFLDAITEQRQIIEHLEPLMNNANDGPVYSTQLYDIYLYCEEFYKARMAIETEFAENYFAAMSNRRRTPELFSDKMRCFLDYDELYYNRYMLTFPMQYDAAKIRLQRNYEINTCRLKELGILKERK